MKTIFGTFKCPQCLYEEGKFDPPIFVRKDSNVNSKLRKKDSPPPAYFDAHQSLEERREREKRRAQKRAEREKIRTQKRAEKAMPRAQKRSRVQCPVQDLSDPLRNTTQKSVPEDIARVANIISSSATKRATRFIAIQTLGREGDPRALGLLKSLICHPDMDIRRYAREAIESIQSRHGV